MSELAKLRHMKIDDYKAQRRKEREWRKALEEVKFIQTLPSKQKQLSLM